MVSKSLKYKDRVVKSEYSPRAKELSLNKTFLMLNTVLTISKIKMKKLKLSLVKNLRKIDVCCMCNISINCNLYLKI